MSIWDQFDQAEAEIDHVRPDGIGYVKSGGTLVEIGPVSSGRGAVAEVALVSESHGVCLTKSVVSGSYGEYTEQMIEKYGLRDELEEDGLMTGEEFSAEIVNVDGSSVGSVETGSGDRLKIGPVSCESGRKVDLEFVGEGFARCLDQDVQSQNYESRFNILTERYDSLPVSIGEEYTGEVIQTYSDNSTVVTDGVHVNVSACDLEVGDEVVFRVIGFTSQSALGEFVEKKASRTNSSSSNGSTATDNVQNLRERAEEQSQSSANVLKTQSTVRQYSRSSAVREYAKARADGVCEGCGSPAPFVDHDGEPYLQVHHLEELSDGGADEPENVACLCPNCHYRIHHGKDGEKFNEQVSDEINRIES